MARIPHHTLSRPASPEEVLALLQHICRPVQSQRLPLDRALGRVLRETVRAPEDQPAFDRSAVDGYAVRLNDQAPHFQVVDELRAGDWRPRRLKPGQTVEIATGAALPCEGLQVVRKEDARIEGETLYVLRRGAGRHIRFRGEDVRRGRVLAKPGLVLQPGTLSLLAGVGHTRARVSRPPRILHVATGGELTPPTRKPRPGCVRDSNSTLVRAFFQQQGLAVCQFRVGDDQEEAAARIQQATARLGPADLLLLSGGASVGRHDFARRLFQSLGYRILVSRTRTRPGKPLIVARRGRSLALGLPGNPLAHLVCLSLYVQAALEGFSGQNGPPPFRRGLLKADLESDGNARETFWPACCCHGGGAAWLSPLAWRSSGDLTPLARANALIRVPAGSRRLPRASEVEFVSTFPPA